MEWKKNCFHVQYRVKIYLGSGSKRNFVNLFVSVPLIDEMK